MPTYPSADRVGHEPTAADSEPVTQTPRPFRTKLLPRLSAPILATRPIFPGRFARALARVAEDPSRRSISSVHARRFFRDSLVLLVDPRSMTHELCEPPPDGRSVPHLDSRFIGGGDWSDMLQPIEACTRHRDMLQLVRYGRDYRQTQRYKIMKEMADRGTPIDSFGKYLDSEQKIDAYFEYYLQVIDNIRRFG